jgi:hypothetical protein
MFLISFDLFMFTDCSFKLKFKVSVLDHVFVAFSVEFVELSGVVFFSFLQLLKLLFKSDFHLRSVFSVLVEQIFQMLDDVFFGNGIFTTIDFQEAFKAFSGFFLDFISCKFHVQ